MKRVRTLLRVSSRQQLRDDDIPIQRAEAAAYIAEREDWQFDREYLEKAVSAYKNRVEDRGILMEILGDAKAKEFDVLLAYMSDRIGRKEEYSTYVATLNRLGVEVWTIKDGQLKTEEHIDKLLNFIRFWQNEGESKKTGMRVRDAQIEQVKAGRFVGGRAPYGYDLVPSGEISSHGRVLHEFRVNEEQAKVVKKIYDYAVCYAYGAYKIAGLLNEERIPPINDAWRSGTVAQILKNPIYMGYVSYGRRKGGERGDLIRAREQNQSITIIPQEQWEQAQKIRESHRQKLKGQKDGPQPCQTTGTLLLMGCAYCGYCGARLTNGSVYNHWTTKDGKKHKKISGRYKCTKRGNAAALCEGKAFYRQEELENAVFAVIGRYLDGRGRQDMGVQMRAMRQGKREQAEQELNQLKKQLSSMESDIATLEDKIPEALRGACIFPQEKLAELLGEKEDKRMALARMIGEKEREIKKLEAPNELLGEAKLIPNWREEFCRAPIPLKKVIIAALIERIEVRSDCLTVQIKPDRESFFGPDTGDIGTTLYIPDSE